MSTVTLEAKLKAMKLTQFSFKSFKRDVSSPNDEGKRHETLVFELVDPIPLVESSSTTFVQELHMRVADRKQDVTTIICSQELVLKYSSEFTFDEDSKGKFTFTGKYEGDMFLDLSRSGNVWLTDTKFSKMGMDWRNNKQQEKTMSILAKTPELLKKYQESIKTA